jgi:thiol-disulfide isomerase/thioredoxin
MRKLPTNFGLAIALAGFGASIAVAQSTNTGAALDGRWDATLVNKGTTIPFRLDISGSGPTLKGTFYNGFVPYDGTTGASFQDGTLVLNVDHYLSKISATLKDGALDGSLSSTGRGGGSQYEFHATKHMDSAVSAANVPNIAGSWILALPKPSAKGEKACHCVVEQRGAEVAASILRVDGDTGAYSGTYKDGKWVLSHFDGSRPGVIEVTPQQDGTLEVLQGARSPGGATAANEDEAIPAAKSRRAANASATADPYAVGPAGAVQPPTAADSRYTPALVGYREDVAVAKSLPLPENYETHTTARNPNEKLTFTLPDDHGKLVSNDDPRFKGKVVLAIVTGTWCPNCHDEAQYLVQLDKKYRDKGLAIVALDFEEQAQQGGLERERAFVKQYGVNYTYLIAGDPSEMWEKVPQLVNLNTWPATIFVGRDGTIKSVHSGFASPASGKFNDELKAEFEAKIQKLLAERPAADVSTAEPVSTEKPGE